LPFYRAVPAEANAIVSPTQRCEAQVRYELRGTIFAGGQPSLVS